MPRPVPWVASIRNLHSDRRALKFPPKSLANSITDTLHLVFHVCHMGGGMSCLSCGLRLMLRLRPRCVCSSLWTLQRQRTNTGVLGKHATHFRTHANYQISDVRIWPSICVLALRSPGVCVYGLAAGRCGRGEGVRQMRSKSTFGFRANLICSAAVFSEQL